MPFAARSFTPSKRFARLRAPTKMSAIAHEILVPGNSSFTRSVAPTRSMSSSVSLQIFIG